MITCENCGDKYHQSHKRCPECGCEKNASEPSAAPICSAVLSIRQPWAWLICHAGKDIENRTWPTKFRGRFLVHAGKGMTHGEYDAVVWLAREQGITLPPFEALDRGGIIGEADIVDCVTQSDSPWFYGKHGFVLANAKPLHFSPCKGQLGFFHLPNDQSEARPH